MTLDGLHTANSDGQLTANLKDGQQSANLRYDNTPPISDKITHRKP